MLTGDLELVDSYDGHCDVVYGTYDPKYLTRWQSKKDFVFSRQWFRGQDGSYTILQLPAIHKKCPPKSGYRRKQLTPSTWEIRNLNSPMGSDDAKCLVTQMLEIHSSSWPKWKQDSCSKFQKSTPYALLCQVGALKEYIGANPGVKCVTSTTVVHSKTSQVSASNDESDTEGQDEFYDAIADDSSTSSSEEESDPDDENEEKEMKVKLKNVSWAIASLALKRKSATDAHEELDDVPLIMIDPNEFHGSMPQGKDNRDSNCWASPSGLGFMIRGKTYLKDNCKVVGGDPLLKLIAVDWFKVEKTADRIAQHPKCLVQSEAGKKLPFILVINLQVPAKPNYSLVLYYASDRPVKKNSLLGKFVDGTDMFRDSRFKLIPSIVEGYWMVKRAVGTKACLLGKAVTCNYLRQDNFLEIDVDIGSSSVARGVIGLVLGYITSLIVDLVILIEGREEDELPEYILGTVRLNRVKPETAKHFEEQKEEGNRLFQKKDYEGALLKYEKGLRLLPGNHIDVSQLRTNMAACHMQLGLGEYPNAIHECNLALEVTPRYTKALLKRARCYEGLNRLDLALRDVSTVISMEPNNLTALEFGERVREAVEKRGLMVNNNVIELPLDYIPPNPPSLKERTRKKNKKSEEAKVEDKTEEPKVEEKTEETKVNGKSKEKKVGNKARKKKAEDRIEEKRAEDKAVVEEEISVTKEVHTKTVKLVFGEDIRRAQLPLNCSLLQLREVIEERFPNSGSVLVKFKDQEGDLVTITSTEELRWAEASPESQGSAVRLYIVEVNPEHDPLLGTLQNGKQETVSENGDISKNKNGSTCIGDWIIEFAQVFKNYIGLDCDEYLNLHELGMKLYSDAMEEVVTGEEAQTLFDGAAGKFQEMAALALFNWGNVHMSRARKRVYFAEDASKESILSQISAAHDWAINEYSEAGIRYEEAVKIKPDFYEGFLALGQQQFEQAKLSWYYTIGSKPDSDVSPSTDVLQLYNSAEDNMEKGMHMWEESEEQRLNELSKPNKAKEQLRIMGLQRLFTDISADEAAEQAANMRSQINLLWGTMLYERSIVEFKLGLPVWQECLEVAIEKFELAGASPTDTAVMIKNHCSNTNAVQGLSFKIDEIVQAWNEMYEAKRWSSGVPSFRLEPLLRRRVSKLFNALDNA